MKNSGSSPIKKNIREKADRKKPDKKTFSRKKNDKPFEKKYSEKGDSSEYHDDRKKPSDKKFSSKKPYKSRDEEKHYKTDRENVKTDRPFKKFPDKDGYQKRERKPYEKDREKSSDRPIERYVQKRTGEDKKTYSDKPYPSRERKYDDYKKHSDKKFSGKDDYKKRSDRPYEKNKEKGSDRPVEPYVQKRRDDDKKPYPSREGEQNKKYFSKDKRPRLSEPKTYIGRKREYREAEILVKDNTYAKRRSFSDISDKDGIRLNKFIANAGICSRREADTLIETGVIAINGKVITKLGTKVMPGDVVKFNDEVLSGEQHQYLLLNKPKGYITTTDDPQERKTVMEIIKNACKERIYPVGRLDKNTSGLLLFTNDGDLAKKLTHPKHLVEKVYQAELDKALSKTDMLKILEGIELDDGLIKVDAIAYGETKKEIGIELHSGKNRVVRRIFESLGYDVVKLDRVVFAGLTKKEVPRGKYRFLSDEEVNILRRIR